MTALGQNRKWQPPILTSALPPITDIHRLGRYVRFVPTTDSCTAAIVASRSSGLCLSRANARSRPKRDLEKIKTISDAHVVAAGLPTLGAVTDLYAARRNHCLRRNVRIALNGQRHFDGRLGVVRTRFRREGAASARNYRRSQD
jgi:hypothetical protein